MDDIKKIISFSVDVTRGYRFCVFIMFLTAFIWAVDLSIKPYLVKMIVDELSKKSFEDSFMTALIPLCLYFFMTFLVATAFRFYNYFVEIKMVPSLRKKINNVLFNHLMNTNLLSFQNYLAGSFSNKINDLTNSIPEILQIAIDKFFAYIFGLIIAIGTLWHVNSKFSLVIIVWVTSSIIISFFCSTKIQILSDDWSESKSEITGKIVDALKNIISIKLFTCEKYEEGFLNETYNKSVFLEKKLYKFYFWMWMFYAYSFVVVQGACLYFLLTGYQNGIITIGDFALVLGLNLSIIDFLWTLTKDFSHFSKLLGTSSQALRVLALPLERKTLSFDKKNKISKGQIEFKDVTFKYPDSHCLFKDLSIIISHGEKVGIVGYSGSGKSTFINLILKFFDVTTGSIAIDGVDINHLDPEKLRESICVVPQSPILFHRTLRENIQYGKNEVTEEEIIKAAEMACAHHFISKLPEEYQTITGENGYKLSGGQRQRIGLSRAFLKDSSILILDEITNQLDAHTEQIVYKNLWDFAQNKTVLLATHRLSVLTQVDRILVFDNGAILQDGSHRDLMHQEGLYRTLWESQSEGFLAEKRINTKKAV
ncbi:MAG: ABC transporter ATP-binding protein/permease [Alphaproteobacteria bacterium]|nr:ABC transporter ATP-binding protein/permease [Alphaproteobacteria bacterium]MBY0501887.1 ABC transporter ATP-binding protein/permease [Alphaproteobacteria bacterium]